LKPSNAFDKVLSYFFFTNVDSRPLHRDIFSAVLLKIWAYLVLVRRHRTMHSTHTFIALKIRVKVLRLFYPQLFPKASTKIGCATTRVYSGTSGRGLVSTFASLPLTRTVHGTMGGACFWPMGQAKQFVTLLFGQVLLFNYTFLGS
jgi:hypothetical protein